MAITVLDPTVPAAVHPTREARPVADLHGVRVGFMTNEKPNADTLLRDVAQILAERYGIQPEFAGKGDPSRIASAALLDDLSARNHAIVTGIGD